MIEKQTKFKVYNNDEHFGDEVAEYFDCLQDAQERKEKMIQEIYEIHIEEIFNQASKNLLDQIYFAIELIEDDIEE